MKLALFDLDHTLLNTDSDHSWGEFLVSEGLVDPVQHRSKTKVVFTQTHGPRSAYSVESV